jgi:hypothetical protein
MNYKPIIVHDNKKVYPTARAELYEEIKHPNQKEFVFSKYKTEKERIVKINK